LVLFSSSSALEPCVHLGSRNEHKNTRNY
jgi:hypothetical protein